MSAPEDNPLDQGEATVDDPDALGAPSKRVRPGVNERNLGASIGKAGQTLKEALADIYKMDYPKRGKAIIINNKNFSFAMEAKGYKTRQGTDEDACSMMDRLQYLGFNVEMHKNQTCAQMMDILVQAAQFDHSDADCFVCVLLSHGEEGIIFGVDGPLEIKNIFNLFKGQNCRTLAGKPKLFFIQACRGSNLDKGVYLNVTDGNKRQLEEDEFRIPSEADFLVAYSTVPGYYSWRNSQKGSWFIQALQFMLLKHGTSMEIMKLMTKVNKIVVQDFESNTFPSQPTMHQMKQTACICSMLTKDLIFTPKECPMEIDT
ncbi:hypothetical protein CHS0354_003301 [Potamilus streckersoni]|uniref:Caspase-3 n=1 Tax=Potamilus streckersoni TaxID=2493646 RepID=A0AAE0S5D2_9BIVA|nr:hypothetical protein CHS0354_003301 [Potamilus streckersoni]